MPPNKANSADAKSLRNRTWRVNSPARLRTAQLAVMRQKGANMVLPKHEDTSITGGLGVTIIQESLERKGWIFRRQDGDTDFGIDGERNHR